MLTFEYKSASANCIEDTHGAHAGRAHGGGEES